MIWGWYTCTVILFLMAAVASVDIPWSDQWCDRDSRREDLGPQPPTLPHPGGLSSEWSHSSACLCVSMLQGARNKKCHCCTGLIKLIWTVGGGRHTVNGHLFVWYIDWTDMYMEEWGDWSKMYQVHLFVQCNCNDMIGLICMCRSEEAADVMISEAEYVTVQAKLNEMLCAVCDHAHDRCVKVITARSKVI